MKTLLLTISLIAITPVNAQNYQAQGINPSLSAPIHSGKVPKPQKKGNLSSKLAKIAGKALKVPLVILSNLGNSSYNGGYYDGGYYEEASTPTPSYMPQTYMLSGPTGQMQTVNVTPFLGGGGMINYGPVMGLR